MNKMNDNLQNDHIIHGYNSGLFFVENSIYIAAVYGFPSHYYSKC